MGSSQPSARINAETEALNPRYVTAAVTLRPGNQNIIADSTAAAFTVTLPDIGESVGNVICITAPEGASEDTVTVAVNETGSTATSGSMDADDDYTVWYNSGLVWVVLSTNVA